jgi:hypothetical protein
VIYSLIVRIIIELLGMFLNAGEELQGIGHGIKILVLLAVALEAVQVLS